MLGHWKIALWYANIWLVSVLNSHTITIWPTHTGILSWLVHRLVEDEPIPETPRIQRVHYTEARPWDTSIAKHLTVMIPIRLLQINAVEAKQLEEHQSGKASQNTVHLRDVRRWHTVQHICSVCVTGVDIDVRSPDAPGVLTRPSTAHVMAVVHAANGRVVQRVQYLIRASVDVTGEEVVVSTLIAPKEPDRVSISALITEGSIPVLTPTARASPCSPPATAASTTPSTRSAAWLGRPRPSEREPGLTHAHHHD